MAKRYCKSCALAVTPLAGPARALTGKRRPFAALAKPNSTTAISCNVYKTAIAAFIAFMPTFRFNREDAEEVVNYMKSIQKPSKPK